MKPSSFLRLVPKTTMYEISKLIVNSDVLDYIKSYCYYNYRDSLVINTTKHYKLLINSLILEAISRTSGGDFENHWAFGFPSDSITERLQLQAENCDRCGNYISVSHDTNLYPQHIFCNCRHQ